MPSRESWLALGVGLTLARGAFGEPSAVATAVPPVAPAAPAPAAPARLSHDDAIPSLTYAQVLERATADTPRMASARASVLRAEAEVQKSRAAWLPTLNGVASYTRLDGDRVIGDRVTQPANSFNLSAQLFVPLVVPARWVDTARQEDSLTAAQSSAEDTRRLAVVDATRAFLAVALEQQALEIAQRALDTAKSQASFMARRNQEGVGSRLEQARAEREVHNNEANVAARRAALRSTQEALGVATFTDGPVDAAGPVAIGGLPLLPDALRTAQQRPDLVALRQQADVAERRVDSAWLDYMPTLSASGQVFYQAPPTINFPEFGWQAQLLLVVPLYDGGLRYGNQHEREANRLEASSSLQAAELRARADVRATAAEADNRYAAWVETEKSVQLSREALELSRLAFQEGSGTQIDLIEAERSARDAETNAAIAQTGWLQAQLLYRLAAGQM